MTDKALFELALRTPETERAALLDCACEGKPELRQRVEALLKADGASAPFHSQPAAVNASLGDQVTSGFSMGDTAGTVIGSYKLLQKLGEGGMGTVWVAEQDKPVKRRVALKLVKAGMDSAQVLRRFEAERQALAMMDHTNIAKVFDAGTTTTGRPYFVMELVKGVPITKYCDEVHASIQDRLELFIQVCSAVQHAHQKGVIHRDIKPSNVLVAMQDGKPVPKVIDFGVAKALHTKLADRTMYTEIGQIIGTLEYMSPEQAELSAMDIDTRADIYALGVLLYELLTGSTPITRERLKSAAFVEVIRLIKEEEPQRPSTRLSESKETLASLATLRRTDPKKLSSTMRGELDWVVMKALEKDRTRRYETANGLARDIQRYLADEVVEARAPTAGYRLKKFVRRNVGKVLAATLVLGALLLGIVGTTWGLFRANAATEGERLAKEQAVAEKKKAIEFRDKALDALRAMTGEDVKQLIGAKPQLSATERAYLEAIAMRWQVFARTEGTDEQSRAIQAEGHFRVAQLWQHLGRLEEARQEYVQAVATWEKLVAELPAFPTYRHELANSYNNLGNVLSTIGKLAEAEKEYRKSIGIRDKLAVEFPSVSEYSQNLAGSHYNLGILLNDARKYAEAKVEYSKTIAIMTKLVFESPSIPNYRQDLANGHNNLGKLLSAMGDRTEAEQEFRKAIAIKEKLVVEFPTNPSYRSELALGHGGLGVLLAESGKQDKAKEEYYKAIVNKEKMVADFPSVPKYAVSLGASYCNFGNLIRGSGKPADSLVWYGKAIRILTPIYEQDSRAVEPKLYLRNSYWNRTNAHERMKLYAEAVKDWNMTIQLSSSAELQGFRAIRANFKLHAGQVTEAVTEVAELTAPGANATGLATWNANQWYGFACVYAVASGKFADKKEEYAKRSLDLLQQAVNAGYRNGAHMKKDTDLDPLRDREDFKKLMAEWEAKLPPKKQTSQEPKK